MPGIPVNFATEATKASAVASYYKPTTPPAFAYTQAVMQTGISAATINWPIPGTAASPQCQLALWVQGTPDAAATSFAVSFNPARTQMTVTANDAVAGDVVYVNVVVLVP